MEDYTTYELEELYEIASQVQQAIELKEEGEDMDYVN